MRLTTFLSDDEKRQLAHGPAPADPAASEAWRSLPVDPEPVAVETIDTRTPSDARSEKLALLVRQLGARLHQLFPADGNDGGRMSRPEVLALIAQVLTAAPEERQALVDLESAAAAHRAALLALGTVAAIDAHDLTAGWPA